ncbi:flagellar protein export ATPase FliI [Chelativorans sp. AA-79]|uniref:flagellar protein export ATPase FliI n=1 Tax=Chelativorans sp. AA-79 TaxID=3028735 RepID=UPI0023F844FB|nr:flagellar protein export ATPase FliI [Chelativorans sp. AA-79]WEX08303.1 flagellar protein export ATPase FliI [Chelativorans sp. AA-79]
MDEAAATTAQSRAGRDPDTLTALGCAFRRFGVPGRTLRYGGRICEVTPTHYRVRGLSRAARLGDIVSCRIHGREHRGEVVRISSDDVLVAPFERDAEARLGQPVFTAGALDILPHESWRGRVIDALARPIDDGPPLIRPAAEVLAATPRTPAALRRQRVATPFLTGVRVVDLFTPLCHGQRIGIFAGSGVGKSTLLAMLARAEAFDTVVVAMVGERGREVREFLEDTLGPAGMRKTVAVVATSDESPMMRRRAADTAMRVAEHFRDCGEKVLLLLDSITRYAHAAREVATGTGEPPVARGYPASVFTDLPRLLERAGPGEAGHGSITAIFSVLVDGDDHNDPVADSVRGILDGHLVLDRAIAEQGRFPAVDPLASISRLADRAWDDDRRKLVQRLKSMIARFEETRDIRLLGGFQPGIDAELDLAVRQVPIIYDVLQQSPKDGPSMDPLGDLAGRLKAKETSRDG